MSEDNSMEDIQKQRDLDHYFVAVNKGFEEQGGNFLYASTLNELALVINRLEENQVLVPMKDALEKNYPIQSLNTYEWLHEIANDYLLSFEINQRASDSLGEFQYQNEEVLLVGHVENDRLIFSFTDPYGDHVSTISEREPIAPDQVAILNDKNFEEKILIDQGYLQVESVSQYKNKYREEINVFQLTKKGMETKQAMKERDQNSINKEKTKQKSLQREMDL